MTNLYFNLYLKFRISENCIYQIIETIRRSLKKKKKITEKCLGISDDVIVFPPSIPDN